MTKFVKLIRITMLPLICLLIFFITGMADTAIQAVSIVYRNTVSELNSSNVQAAIDEMVERLQAAFDITGENEAMLAAISSPACPSSMRKVTPKVCIDSQLQQNGTTQTFFEALNACDDLPTRKRLCAVSELIMACRKYNWSTDPVGANKYEWSGSVINENIAIATLYNDCGGAAHYAYYSTNRWQYRCCMDL